MVSYSGGFKKTGCDPNNKVFIVDISKHQLAKVIIPGPEIGRKACVAGQSSHMMGNHTLVITGGTLPPAGLGGRSTFMLTTKAMTVRACDLKEKCACTVDFSGDTAQIGEYLNDHEHE